MNSLRLSEEQSQKTTGERTQHKHKVGGDESVDQYLSRPPVRVPHAAQEPRFCSVTVITLELGIGRTTRNEGRSIGGAQVRVERLLIFDWFVSGRLVAATKLDLLPVLVRVILCDFVDRHQGEIDRSTKSHD